MAVHTDTQSARANVLLLHMYDTYRWLRFGLSAVALVLPPLLWAGGGELRESISAYYHHPIMRDWFVGLLWAAAAGLVVYKGFSRREDIALNLAGIFAIGVAMVPVNAEASKVLGPLTLHGVFAVLFFLALAYVAIFRAPDTLDSHQSPTERTVYRGIYRTLGIAMVVLPLTAAFFATVGQRKEVTFFVESAAIYAFAFYWMAKSREMRDRTKEDREQLMAIELT